LKKSPRQLDSIGRPVAFQLFLSGSSKFSSLVLALAGRVPGSQDEITSRIANALDIELIGAEAARPIENPDALDYILRGRAASFKSPTPEKFAEAIDFFDRALALQPHSVEAKSLLAAALANRALDLMTDTAAADLARACVATKRRSPNTKWP